MRIRYMNATFGALDQSELTLQPGLNIIYAPNESGKSTWSRFMRNMLYGVNTRDRNALADKNRYAPWSGAAMSGRMDVTTEDGDYTLLRQTRRANAPMGEFSCTFSGTATPVPGITAQNAGEQLLGITPEVFARSAFISQTSLAVDQDAELERRIAALITTGEEDTSYSETVERLKKQLNRRRHNKTGQIPALEREIGDLDRALVHLEELRQQRQRTEEQLDRSHQHLTGLQEQQRQWELVEQREKWQRYHDAIKQAEQARSRLEALTLVSGRLPDDAQLAGLDSRCMALRESGQTVEKARRTAAEASASARELEEACRKHPLYPADEEGLRSRIDQITLPALPKAWPMWAALILCLCALASAVAAFILHAHPAIGAGLAVLAALGAALFFAWRGKCSRTKRNRANAENERTHLSQQMEEYLPLRQNSQHAAVAAAQESGRYDAMRAQQESGIQSLLSDLAPFQAAADLPGAAAAISELRRKRDAMTAAEQEARDAELRRQLFEDQLKDSEVPDLTAPLPQPSIRPAQLAAALPQAAANLQAMQSRLDTLTGQIRSMGDPDDLITHRAQKQEQLERLQDEYDAIAMAMNALESANLTLQNRFSPALGAHAAEIFADITGGKYHKVLLGRDFSLAAEARGDTAQRSVQLLSQGATDQLYLSVRLAICDMVLPRDKAVPLIMDDALVTFDDNRLHAALDYLLQESKQRQILLFTCQKREAAYLTGRDGVNLVTL